MTKRIRCAAIVLLAGALGVLTAAPAQAAVVTETVQGRYVQIVSSADWSDAAAMSDGRSVRWDLTVSAHAPDPGSVRVSVSASGAAPLSVDVRTCAESWQDSGCPSGERTLRAGWVVPRGGQPVEVEAISADDVAHLRLDVRVGDDARQGSSTQIRVHADGFGDAVQIGPGAEHALPATGGAVPVLVIVVGGVLVLAAAVILVVGARRRRGGDER
ncbi:MAG: LPXTG cell wall anchor domain-containing protein [Microbacterium sp.]|jgi:LPXTG-motif cell wall-anchored protein|uniref:LPXTG cell wall anchor domain-containing protein n=1 Tax=Microbacterium sp. TaxID=51671 RepID=UPI00282A3DFE|nr:LPXTG cell wall anchor domain-containing protein [Microbacterium sp.]MDR2322242.1 LPXTG cell wall anchor domain-containing protein [Microbacterium sp.]